MRPLPAAWRPADDEPIPWWATDAFSRAVYATLLAATAILVVLLSTR